MTDQNKDDFDKPVAIAFYDVDYVKNPKGNIPIHALKYFPLLTYCFEFSRHELLQKQVKTSTFC